MEQRAALAQMCTASNGETGSFLFKGDDPKTGELVTQVFQSTQDLLIWIRAEGWLPVPGTFAGVWVKPTE